MKRPLPPLDVPPLQTPHVSSAAAPLHTPMQSTAYLPSPRESYIAETAVQRAGARGRDDGGAEAEALAVQSRRIAADALAVQHLPERADPRGEPVDLAVQAQTLIRGDRRRGGGAHTALVAHAVRRAPTNWGNWGNWGN